MKEIPNKIYLQICDEFGEELCEKTWCEDRIYETDIEYERVDCPHDWGERKDR